jgi:formate/nitrite transporter FocA (FNT family)
MRAMGQDGRDGRAVNVVERRGENRRDAPHQPAETDEEPKPLGQEASEIIDDASQIGAKRLHRSLLGSAINGFIGGMSVSFGAVAMVWMAASVGGDVAVPSAAHIAGALAFPIGFVILLIGKSELFTENFFLPVTAVLERRGSVGQLGALWGVSLAANLIGALLFALLISRPGVLDPGPARQMISLAEHNVGYPFGTAFVKAIFAGWLMTMLTWLLIAAEGIGPRLTIIWLMGTLIVLGQFNHVVISAAEVFMAMFLGAPIGVGDWLDANFLPALAGNVAGGLFFVTLLHYVQAKQHDQEGSGAK